MPEEIIRVEDRFYILATSPRVDEQSRVLKYGETFAVFDRLGDMRPVGLGEEGLYREGTRFLSRLTLRLLDRYPLLLSSTVHEDNSLLTVDLTNPDIEGDAGVRIPRDVLHVFRSCFLEQGVCHVRFRVHNYALEPVPVSLELTYDGDYADIFEVRGMRRERRGTRLPPVVEPAMVRLGYRGLDEVERHTRLEFKPAPTEVTAAAARLDVDVPPHGEVDWCVRIACEVDDGRPLTAPGCARDFDEALSEIRAEMAAAHAREAAVRTSNEQFNDWLNRSAADLHLMVTRTPDGPYPYAGVPWFSTAFGRDGILTALEYLWVNPELARGVLTYLAANQATEIDPENDAEPGKILHETRRGEMAALGEIPFGRYYGTVDATPLFVVLAGAYYRRTADRDFIEGLWPHIEAALRWIDRYGDADGDGFVDYSRRSSKGLVTQGWKDSWDSVFHADGRLAEGPIALCEVQSYVYAAQRAGARMAAALGRSVLEERLLVASRQLRARFEKTFWCEELSTYALALDGLKRPCRVRTSNAGHCLFSGIASPERAARVAATLSEPSSFSGWGIRTVASTEARYNPMAYHNGSVWPHDNAVIAWGFARYGLKRHVLDVLSGLFDASVFVDLHRMPELFCGFRRRPGEGPTLYPVACAPQAWAAATPFLLLAAALGLVIDAPRRRIRFDRPALPDALDRVRIDNLQVGPASVDLVLERVRGDVVINLARREGDLELVIVK